MTDHNSAAADAEAARLAAMDDADEALELRQAEIERDTRAELLATLADGTGDLSDLIDAIDDAMASCTLTPLAIINVLRGDARALATWTRNAIDRAAETRANAYTADDMAADKAAYEARWFDEGMK